MYSFIRLFFNCQQGLFINSSKKMITSFAFSENCCSKKLFCSSKSFTLFFIRKYKVVFTRIHLLFHSLFYQLQGFQQLVNNVHRCKKIKIIRKNRLLNTAYTEMISYICKENGKDLSTLSTGYYNQNKFLNQYFFILLSS